MRKNLKKIAKVGACLLIVLIAIVTTNLGDAKSAPSTLTVERAYVLNDIITNHDHAFVQFKTTDGDYIYCLDVDKTPLESGQTVSVSGTGDAGLLYLLQNGYPNVDITGNQEFDFYVTQAAIWWYLDETGQGASLSSEFKNATTTDIYKAIPNYIEPMVEAAKNATDTQDTPSMSVSTNGTTLTLTDDELYYESGYMYASVVGTSTYNVAVTGGTDNTAIVDEDGNLGSTMNSGEKFKIRVPAAEATDDMEITVSITASGSKQVAKIYSSSDSSYQRVIGLYDEITPLSKTVTLTLTPEEPDKHYCEYTDDTYYGKDGDVVDEDTYKEQCEEKHYCEYIDDTYYGKDGDVVDKNTYNEQCGNKSCEYVDGNYYDEDGNIVDRDTYDKECNHYCEYYNGSYYGVDGNIVDESTFNNECGEEVIVPDTDSNISPLAVVIGLLMVVGGCGLIVSRKN